jgi:hypothetical protein
MSHTCACSQARARPSEAAPAASSSFATHGAARAGGSSQRLWKNSACLSARSGLSLCHWAARASVASSLPKSPPKQPPRLEKLEQAPAAESDSGLLVQPAWIEKNVPDVCATPIRWSGKYRPASVRCTAYSRQTEAGVARALIARLKAAEFLALRGGSPSGPRARVSASQQRRLEVDKTDAQARRSNGGGDRALERRRPRWLFFPSGEASQ